MLNDRNQPERAAPPAVVTHVLAALLALLLAGVAPGAGNATEIGWDGQHLSISDAEGPVVTVLEDIALTIGAGLDVRGELGDVRHASIAAGEPGNVIRELVRPHSLVLRFDGNTGLPRQILVREGDGGSYGFDTSEPAVERLEPPVINRPSLDDEMFKSRLRDLSVDGGPLAAREIARMSAGPARPEMRRLAIVALTRIGGNEALSVLRDGLRDPHPHIRLQSARGLRKLLGAGAQADLSAAMQNESDETVHAAMERLAGQRP